MTREEAIKEFEYGIISDEAVKMAIKALEQSTSDDVKAIHTQGLDEGIRCAMCTNSMRSDMNCDGGCIVNENMYKAVMNTINNHIFEQSISDDCVSRQEIQQKINRLWNSNGDKDYCMETLKDFVAEMPPVKPVACIAEIKFSKEDMQKLVNEKIKEITAELEERWIPCSERLPEENMACLVSVGKLNFRQLAMYSDLMGIKDHKIFYQGNVGYADFEDITEKVNAWMPLPKPYKGEKDEKNN